MTTLFKALAMSQSTGYDTLEMNVIFSNEQTGFLLAEGGGVAMHFHTISRSTSLPKKGEQVTVTYGDVIRSDNHPTLELSSISWTDGNGEFYTDSYDGLNYEPPSPKAPKLHC